MAEPEKKQPARKQPAQQRRQRNNTSVGPGLLYTTINIKHVFNTRESLQMGQQVLENMNKSLLWIEIALDRIDSEMIDLSKFSEDITGAVVYGQLIECFEERIEAISLEMDQEIDRLSKIRNDNRVNITATHKNPRNETIEANNSIVAQFLILLTKYDELLEETFILNFAGVLTRHQRKEVAEGFKKKLRRFARTIIDVNQEAQKRVQASKQRAASPRNHPQTAPIKSETPDKQELQKEEVKADKEEQPAKQVEQMKEEVEADKVEQPATQKENKAKEESKPKEENQAA